MRRIGIICAYRDDWHADRLVHAASRVAQVDVLRPTDFSVVVDHPYARVRVRGEDAARWDAFLTPRAVGDDGDADFQIEAYRLLREEGRLVVNDVGALLAAVDKLRSSVLFRRAGVPTPRTIVCQSAAELRVTLAAWGEAILKPLYGSLGDGIRLLGAGAADGDAGERLCRRYRAPYLQERVRDARDLRVFVVGERVTAAIERRAPPGELRANVSLGAEVRPCSVGERVAAVAVAAARAVGLEYTGVDVLDTSDRGPLVLEVNGTPQWQGVLRATARDMAFDIVDHVLHLVERRGPRPRSAERHAEGGDHG